MSGMAELAENPNFNAKDFNLFEKVTMDDYHEFKKDVRDARKETFNSLNQYKHSQALLELLDKSLGNKDQESRAYL